MNLARSLVNDGHRVTILSRTSVDLSEHETRLGISWAGYDFLISSESARKPEIIINLANFYTKSQADASELVEANVAFPLSLAKFCVSVNCKLIHVGSYFEEIRVNNPAPTYSATKQLARVLLQSLAAEEGLRLSVVTAFDLYGDRDPRKKLIPTLVTHFRKRGNPTLRLGNPNQPVPLLHISDFCQGITQILDAAETDYSLAPDTHPTIGELVKIFRELSTFRGSINWSGGDKFDLPPKSKLFPGPKGWAPQTQLSVGLKSALSRSAD